MCTPEAVIYLSDKDKLTAMNSQSMMRLYRYFPSAIPRVFHVPNGWALLAMQTTISCVLIKRLPVSIT